MKSSGFRRDVIAALQDTRKYLDRRLPQSKAIPYGTTKASYDAGVDYGDPQVAETLAPVFEAMNTAITNLQRTA